MRCAIVFALGVIFSGTEAFAQGTVNFANNSFSAVYCDFVGGQRVPRGPFFQAELMYAPDGTPTDLFDTVAIRLGAAATFNSPVDGIFIGGARTAPTASPGGIGLFQVRVWESAYGFDYRSTVASGNPNAHAGTSAILRVDTGNPTLTPPETPVSLVGAGLTSFSIGGLSGSFPCIPEPSTCALALLGASLLWFLRRRA